MSETQVNDYFDQAGSWADDQLNSIRSSRRVAWIVAGVAALVALAEAIALVTLMPLKTVTPYTLLVDRQTGHVQALNPIAQDKISPDAALTQSFLVQYVIAREGFDFSSLQSDFRKISLWSSGEARSDYQRAMQINSPESPLARLPRTSTLSVQVRSVSSLTKDSALVRFETLRRDRGGNPQLAQTWVSIIHFRYLDTPKSAEERFINPLGFEVVRYRRNAETPASVMNEGESAQKISSTRNDTTGLSPNNATARPNAGQP